MSSTIPVRGADSIDYAMYMDVGDGSSTNPFQPGQSVTITAAIPAGGNVIGQVGIDAGANAVDATGSIVTIGAALPAGGNVIGDVGISGTPTVALTGNPSVTIAGTPTVSLSGSPTITVNGPALAGWTPYRNLDCNNTGAVVKASAAALGGWWISNANVSPMYFKLYDKATAPSGSDTPKLTLRLPACATAAAPPALAGVSFAAGLSIRATTDVADNDTVSPNTNDVIANLFYN